MDAQHGGVEGRGEDAQVLVQAVGWDGDAVDEEPAVAGVGIAGWGGGEDLEGGALDWGPEEEGV